MLRLCGLTRLPTPRTVGRWLAAFRARHLPRLQRVNALVVARAIRHAGLRRLTIDVDGSVVSTGQQVQWAHRGYNPHHRKVPSYYPITAYEAQSGQVLRVQNRPGNVDDAKAARRFLRDLFAQLRAMLGAGYPLEFRMDGAFFRRYIIAQLEQARAEYAIKVPFYAWVGLKERVRQTRVWTRVEETVSCAEHGVVLAPWGGRRFRVVLYRRRVQHETTKNFQLDLFDPSDGHYEYSAVVTNKTLSGPALWAFMCGRGVHEKVYGELKSGFAFASVPTMRYAANSAWQLLSVLAFNLMRGFQTRDDRGEAAGEQQTPEPLSLRDHSHAALPLPASGRRDRPTRWLRDARRRFRPSRRRPLQAPRPPPGGVIFCLIEARRSVWR